jgi:HAD superfamily hydrolase (TIGR01509 family)
MDGVLVDGEPLHFEAVNELFAEEGRALSLAEYKPYMGTKAGWRELVQDFGLAHAYEHYRPRYDAMILRQYREKSAPLPGAVEVVRGLIAAGVPVGLASSSTRPWVEACLDAIGLNGTFNVLVTGSDVREGKPDPEIYLKAAADLGVAAVSCLAIEDAPAGIASAKAARMTCWAVRTQYTEGIELPGADRILDSLVDFELGDVLGVAA